MWRRRQWVDLLWHIDHLPRNSLYREAIAADPEVAMESLRQRELASPDAKAQEPRPHVSEFDITADLLTVLVNEMRILRASVIAIAGGGNHKVEPMRGPKYAIEDVETQFREQQHRELAAKLVPHHYQQE